MGARCDLGPVPLGGKLERNKAGVLAAGVSQQPSPPQERCDSRAIISFVVEAGRDCGSAVCGTCEH